MYLVSVVLLLAVLPVVSVLIELMIGHGDIVFLIGKWFVFWAVGVRLGIAGVRQMANPEFTAREIFELEDASAHRIVIELGFANLAMGVVGLVTLARPGWLGAAGLAGAIYYLLAGLQHVRNARRNGKENIALVSDLMIGVALACWLVIAFVQGRA